MILNCYYENSKFVATFQQKILSFKHKQVKRYKNNQIFKNAKSLYNSVETSCFVMRFWVMVN